MRNIHFSPTEGRGAGQDEKGRPRAPLESDPSPRQAGPAQGTVVLEAFISKGFRARPGSMTSSILEGSSEYVAMCTTLGDCKEIVLIKNPNKGGTNDEVEGCSLPVPKDWAKTHRFQVIRKGGELVGFRLEKIPPAREQEEESASSEAGRLMITRNGAMVMLNIPKSALADAGTEFELRLDISGGKVVGWDITPKE